MQSCTNPDPPATRQLCDELVALGTDDENALHVILMSLKDLKRPHDITRIYETAHAKDPNNTDTMVGLFNSYVRQAHASSLLMFLSVFTRGDVKSNFPRPQLLRDCNFAKQQQVATRLNKLLPGGRHLWWIALSIILQARAAIRGTATTALEPTKLLQLAESLVARQASKDGRLDGFEALLVYLDLLLAQVR